MKINKKRKYIIAAAASVLGNLLILLSQQIILNKDLPGSREYLISETLLQNYYNFFSIGAIAVSAGVISYITGVRPFLIAIFMAMTFPLVTVYELIAFPTSHNLLPFECIIYIGMCIPPFIGALIGYNLNKKKYEKGPNNAIEADRE